jgi:hypothetical protein
VTRGLSEIGPFDGPGAGGGAGDLEPGDAGGVAAAALGSLARVCPGSVYEEVFRRSVRQDPLITKVRHRTDNDPPAPDGSHFGHITESVAVLDGIRCFAPPHPKEILETRILKPLDECARMGVDDGLATPRIGVGFRLGARGWSQISR